MSGSSGEIVRALIFADGLAWQNLYRRSNLLAGWTRRKRREIGAQHERFGIIDEALPFALNQPTAPFRYAPGIHSEWLTFQLKIMVESEGSYDHDAALEAWRALSTRRGELRLTVGQHAALQNIASGAEPPISGHDNPHYFDDSACFRAVALVVADAIFTDAASGDDLYADVAADASITNSEDGVWCAQAFVAMLRGALDGAAATDLASLARERLPVGSWTSLEVDRALSNSAAADGLFDLIERLSNDSANHAYDYGNSAPEVLALSLAIIDFTAGRLEPSLLAALSLPRTAASVAPMAGALCGALGAAARLRGDAGPLRGLALPHLAGLQPLALLEELVAARHIAKQTAAPRSTAH